jgi:hypothetical protein
MNTVTFTCPSVRLFIYKTSLLISIKFRMAGFTISCREILISVGYSTIIISVIKCISLADIYTNSAKLWVHHDGQKQRERNESYYSVSNMKTRRTVILSKYINL